MQSHKDRDIFFFDISNDPLVKTESDDLPLLYNTQSVLESVSNILKTEPGERIFNPEFGINLLKYVFEDLSIDTAFDIKAEIETGILRHEPRVKTCNVDVILDYDNNTYILDMTITIKSTNEQEKFVTTLKKIR